MHKGKYVRGKCSERTQVQHHGSRGDLLDGEGSFGLHGANLLRGLLRGCDYSRKRD